MTNTSSDLVIVLEDGEDDVKEVFMKESFSDGVKVVQGNLIDDMFSNNFKCFQHTLDYNAAEFTFNTVAIC